VLATQSIILLDLQKILPFDYQKELTPVAKLVHSTNLLISSKKYITGKYNNFQEMITYAKAHPQELSCGMLTAAGQDSVSMKQTLAAALNVSIPEVDKYIKTVSQGGGAELSAAMVGGHLSMGVSGSEEISSVPCTKKLGINSFVGSWRGIYARTNTTVNNLRIRRGRCGGGTPAWGVAE
jgi:tripartite-type tricarboxylate transporter receptor subunit TctC